MQFFTKQTQQNILRFISTMNNKLQNTSLAMLVLSMAFLLVRVQAQNVGDKYQITAHLGPTIEQLNFRGNKFINWETKSGFFLGVQYRYFVSPKTSIQASLNYHSKGFKNEYPAYDSNGNYIANMQAVGDANYVHVPLSIGFHFNLPAKFELRLDLGGSYGRLINQQFRSRELEDDQQLDDGFIRITNDKSNVKLFNPNAFSVMGQLALVKYINSKGMLAIGPFFDRQFNSAFDPNIIVTSSFGELKPRLDSYGIYLTAGYYFNRQIDKKRKGF